MNDLEKILEFKMTKLEAKAYKLALMWQDSCEREFPNERHTKLRKSGDPRKSNLFKHCYKLARETKGLLPDENYRLYITAQLQILKTQRCGDIHALIEPQILVGDKAWVRWEIWKKHYEKKLSEVRSVEEIGLTEKESKVGVLLDATKKFLDGKGLTTYEAMKEKLDDLTMVRWVTTGMVSCYYIVMSPWVEKWLDGRSFDVFKFDLGVYRPSITPNVEAKFQEMFSREWNG